jgi:hypothetical protein
LRSIVILLLACGFLAAAPTPAFADGANDQPKGLDANEILSRYFAAKARQNGLRGASMDVDIDASVPKLKKQGRLRALRKISELGKITYKVLGFQGDNTVKNEVIARYLEAEQKGGQDQNKYEINKANYKFKYKGEHTLSTGKKIYIFFLTPRHKQVGLFKGELWLDAQSYLPVMEKGRFVKNPSIFFKRVEFVRDYKIEDGTAVPQHMDSTITTRIVGKVNLSIDYSNFLPDHTGPGSERISGAANSFALLVK